MAKVSKRGGFSDRNKIKPENTEIQLKEFDKRTRVQLQNMISQFYQEVYGDEYYGGENIQEFFRYVIGTVYSEPVDTRRTYDDDDVLKMINKTIQEDDYDDVLTLIEAIIQYWEDYRTDIQRVMYYKTCFDQYPTKSLYQAANDFFKDEYVGYRFVDDIIVPISDEYEVTEINQALEKFGICWDDDMDMMFVEDCCQILDSMRVPITASNREEGEYPYYGANGIQDYVADYIFDDELVLLAEDGGNFGSKERPIAYRVSGKCWVNNHAHVLKPKEGLDIDYLCYSLMFYKVDGMVNGATRQKLTQAAMRKMQIPSRSIDEQKYIVDELNRIIRIKEQRQHELRLLDDLIKARFVELFGDPVSNTMNWPVKKLKELSIQINSGNTPKGGSENYVKKGVVFFRSQNVWKDRLEMEDIAYIDVQTHESMKRSSLKHGDILMTKTGRINTENSSLGRAALYMGEDDKANVNGHVYFIRLKPEVNKKFVLRILVSDEYRNLIRSVCVGGIDKRQLNKEHIEDFPIICPTEDMVNKYIAFVDQVDKSKVAVLKIF